MNKNIVKDNSLQNEYEKSGFIVLKKCIPENVINSLLDFHEKNKNHYEPKGIVDENLINTFIHVKNTNYRQNLMEFVSSSLKSIVDELFIDLEIIGGSYVLKPPFGGAISPHLDGSIVDETKFSSYGFWIPLCSTSNENGAISFLKSSHKLPITYRGIGTKEIIDENLATKIQSKSTVISLNAGDAVFYNHRTIHGSSKNKTLLNRIAVNCSLIDSKAELSMFVKPNHEDIIQQYSVSKEFFLDSMEFDLKNIKNYKMINEFKSPNDTKVLNEINKLLGKNKLYELFKRFRS
jgi:hypothetical protein